MKNGVNALSGSAHQGRIPDITLDQVDVCPDLDQTSTEPGYQTVDHDNLVATADKLADKVMADEAGPTGDKGFHGGLPSGGSA